MQNGKIAFVVGHANWGKSMTLRALTNDNFRIKRTKIAGVDFFIRRMSNNDKPKGYAEFMESLNPALHPHLIAALCPQFNDPSALTDSLLTTLKAKGYQLFFWVIEHQHRSSETVTTEEIQLLGGFGKVELFSTKAEAVARAESFKQFVSNVVLSNIYKAPILQ